MMLIKTDHVFTLSPASGGHPFPRLATDEPRQYVLWYWDGSPIGVSIDGNCPPERLARMVTNGMESIEAVANEGHGLLSYSRSAS